MSSLYADEYQQVLRLLIEARKAAGVTQAALAKRMGRPQSFVSKYENGERRLDIVEFVVICRLISADPHALMNAIGVVQ